MEQFFFILAIVSSTAAITIGLAGIFKSSFSMMMLMIAGMAIAVVSVAISASLNHPVGATQVHAAASQITVYANELKSPTSTLSVHRALGTAETIYTAKNPSNTILVIPKDTAPGTYNFLLKIAGFRAANCITYSSSTKLWTTLPGKCT